MEALLTVGGGWLVACGAALAVWARWGADRARGLADPDPIVQGAVYQQLRLRFRNDPVLDELAATWRGLDAERRSELVETFGEVFPE